MDHSRYQWIYPATLPRAQRPWFMVAAIIAILLVSVVHLWHLSEAPPGFYIDEAAGGYAAYSIAETGADEAGRSWPMFPKSIGLYLDPVIFAGGDARVAASRMDRLQSARAGLAGALKAAQEPDSGGRSSC